MFTTRLALQALSMCLLVVSGAASQAALTVYTTRASFLAAVASPGVDTYADLPFNGDADLPAPLARNAGAFAYTATTDSNGFYGAGMVDNPSLSTVQSLAPIVLSGFSPSIRAIGANLYNTDLDGLFTVGDLTVTATDSTGAVVTQVVTANSADSFLASSPTPTREFPCWSSPRSISSSIPACFPRSTT